MTKEEQRKYSLEVYYLRKKHNLCTYCGHEPAEPESVFCSECKIKKREQGLKYYYNLPEEKKQKAFERIVAHQRNRRSKGLCIRCGEPTGGKSLCEKHREEVNQYQKEYQKRKRLKEQEVKNEDYS